MRLIHGESVYGIEVDEKTCCSHYKSEIDIIAIKFKCCGRWFPCFDCHSAVTDHEPKTWATDERDERAILCGNCGHQLSVSEYFGCNAACPVCESRFNPGCANHFHLYFD